jgi:hypothetical protein
MNGDNDQSERDEADAGIPPWDEPEKVDAWLAQFPEPSDGGFSAQTLARAVRRVEDNLELERRGQR